MKKRRKKSFYGMIGFVFGVLVGCIATFFVMNIFDLENKVFSTEDSLTVESESINQPEEKTTNDIKSETDGISVETSETNAEETVADDVFKVESLYCDLYYPLKWEEKVLIEEALNVVHFSANLGEGKQIDIFDVVSAEVLEEGNELEVYIIEYELAFDETWSEEEKQMVREMQEDSSYIVEYLESEGIKVIK